MSADFITRLRSEVLVLYAPMQTLLMEWGKDMESHLSEWVLNHPQAYQEALVKSYEAGCDMGHTATQAASVFRSTAFKVESRVREFNRESARLAREVTPKGCYVVGNISTSNPDFLEPVGDYSEEFIVRGYTEQILALAEGGVDLFHISGNQIDSLRLAVQVVKEKTRLPVIAHNTFYQHATGFHTMYGYDPQKVARLCTEMGADIVGTNCGLFNYADGAAILRQMRAGTDHMLSMQPDAGMAQLIDGKTVHPATPEEMVVAAPDWIQAGARLVGGCCGTTLKHYAMLSAKVREMNRQTAAKTADR